MKRIAAFIMTLLFLFEGNMFVHASDKIVSTADFSYTVFETLTERAIIEFDITANTVSDGIVAIASSSVTPKAYTDYAICFRIRAGGFFDSNNASGFSAKETAYYQANKAYHVEIDADITNQVYNAFVYIDGVKYTIADNYAFRIAANDLGKITVRGGGGVAAGLYSIENITYTKGEGEFETFVLPNFFTENMVLQRNKPHLIYGRASGSVTVTVSDGENILSQATAKAAEGEFKVELEPVQARLEPYTLTVSSKDKTQVVENVFVGDVYLLAGQSNMAQNYNYQTSEQLGNGVTTSNLPTRVTDDRIKHFTINQTASSSETFDVSFKNGAWQSLTADNNKQLSYIGMFFAEDRLAEEPNVPIGIISTAWNGTTINRWMRKSDDNKTVNYTPDNGDIFNNHISPLAGYQLSAILWYQGESDASNPIMYAEAFKALITDWRNLWEDESLPFLFVQLARYSGDNYAPQRNAQMKALELENTGMAVILDTDKGTYKNIHPLGKEKVAERLSLLAKKYVYGEEITAEGPIFESAKAEEGRITVSFREDTIGDGLTVLNPYGSAVTNLCEFEIASANGYFVPAEAVINEDNTVTVSSYLVPEPVYVRYAYSAVPENPNLFNRNGLPAAPFTTDTRAFSASSFLTRGVNVENANVQIAEFNVTPMKDGINGVMGFTSAENKVSAWNSCGITVRFKENGYFEYIDGGSFVTSALEYNEGESYRVMIIADFTDNTYAFIVNDIVLAQQAKFRTGSLAMSNMGRFLIRGGDGEAAEEFFAENMELYNPKENSIIEAENEIFVISPSVNVFAATYEDDTLVNVKYVESSSGAEALEINTGNYKAFFWDKSLKPLQ